MAGFHPPGSTPSTPAYPTAFHPQLMDMRAQLDAIDKETHELKGNMGPGGGAGYLHYHDVQTRLSDLAQQRQALLGTSNSLLNRMHGDVNDANQSLDYTQNVLDPALAERKQMSTTLGNSLYRNDKAPWYDATRWIPRAWDALTNAPGRLRDNESEVSNLQDMQQQLAQRRKELAQVPFP